MSSPPHIISPAEVFKSIRKIVFRMPLSGKCFWHGVQAKAQDRAVVQAVISRLRSRQSLCLMGIELCKWRTNLPGRTACDHVTTHSTLPLNALGNNLNVINPSCAALTLPDLFMFPCLDAGTAFPPGLGQKFPSILIRGADHDIAIGRSKLLPVSFQGIRAYYCYK